MKLAFLDQAVEDLVAAFAFQRDRLGFEAAWQGGEDTVAWMGVRPVTARDRLDRARA